MADDDDIIEERLKLLEGYIAELRELQGVTFQEYLDNKFIRKFVERTLQTALEACLDIGHRLISIEGFRYPSDNKDVKRKRGVHEGLRNRIRVRPGLFHRGGNSSGL